MFVTNLIKYEVESLKSDNFVICMFKISKPLLLCPGWTIGITCYYVIQKRVTWYEAHNLCLKNQSSMAVIEDDVLNETSFLELIKNNKQYWIGLSWNTWKWVHSDSYVTFNNWGSSSLISDFSYINSLTWKTSGWKNNFVVVCMSEATVSSTPEVPLNSIPIFQLTSATTFENQNSLSEGAKAGIGVGVCLLMIIIITIAAILIFKYFNISPRLFKNMNITTPTTSNEHREVINNNRTTTTPQTNQLEYVDLEFPNHYDNNSRLSRELI